MSDEGWMRTVRLAHHPSAVPAARRAFLEDVAEVAGAALPQEVVDETETVIAELVANAILHGAPLSDGTVRVHWKVRPPRVELEVSDGGEGARPVPRRTAAWAPSGRGLRIVRSLAHEWGVADEDGRTTVWAAMGGASRRRI